jgi:hypothetical protein
MAKKMSKSQKEQLFKDSLVPAEAGSGKLFAVNYEYQHSKPVECLGMTFPNDDLRRQYFSERLREKLGDPEFREIEGFPIGTVEDIIAMSDPPFHTACPNPFLADFLLYWMKNKASVDVAESTDMTVPYTLDVSESRNSVFVNAHSYATKVPPQAVMHYILHYTKPGDVMLDSFCGTGMAAVAAQLCDNPPADMKAAFEVQWKNQGYSSVPWGPRTVVASDLAPAATFIGSILTGNDDLVRFDEDAQALADIVESETGWMNVTRHSNGAVCPIHCTIWSDVFICPECSKEIVFWDSAVDLEANCMLDNFPCSHCGTLVGKRGLERALTTRRDYALKSTIALPKQVPVLIIYYHDGVKFEKTPDDLDLDLILEIESKEITDYFPIVAMMHKVGKWGDTWRSGVHAGITHLHHFFTTRNLRSLACAWKHAKSRRMRFMLTSLMYKSSIMCSPLMSNFFAERKGENRGGWVGKERSGTLFRGSIMSEVPIVGQIRTRRSSVAVRARQNDSILFQTCSAEETRLPDNSIDYIFIDPPFGDNRIYSELNFFWEAWHGVFTRIQDEAIVSPSQKKDLLEYQRLMLKAFSECFRVLKPSKWITVEFSNTSAAVWNAIQTALSESGFVIADVRSLDKKQGSINANTTAIAVKQDLVISAYKPSSSLARDWELLAGTEKGAWEVVENHLRHLPIVVVSGSQIMHISERQRHLIFDRLVAFHVQKGVSIPYSAAEFYQKLHERYPERDGMYFLSDQVAAYDKRRAELESVTAPSLFIMDEVSAVHWLRNRLLSMPQTRQDLHPEFTKEIAAWRKHERTLELDELLEQNFLCYSGDGEVPAQIRESLSKRSPKSDDAAIAAKARNRWYVPDPRKETDLEKLRHKALMREFRQYVDTKGKLKLVRCEALRAGFKECWQQKDFTTIVQMAKRLPDAVIQEDPALLMYFDNASLLLGG